MMMVTHGGGCGDNSDRWWWFWWWSTKCFALSMESFICTPILPLSDWKNISTLHYEPSCSRWHDTSQFRNIYHWPYPSKTLSLGQPCPHPLIAGRMACLCPLLKLKSIKFLLVQISVLKKFWRMDILLTFFNSFIKFSPVLYQGFRLRLGLSSSGSYIVQPMLFLFWCIVPVLDTLLSRKWTQIPPDTELTLGSCFSN